MRTDLVISGTKTAVSARTPSPVNKGSSFEDIGSPHDARDVRTGLRTSRFHRAAEIVAHGRHLALNALARDIPNETVAWKSVVNSKGRPPRMKLSEQV